MDNNAATLTTSFSVESRLMIGELRVGYYRWFNLQKTILKKA